MPKSITQQLTKKQEAQSNFLFFFFVDGLSIFNESEKLTFP
jgi:hypothetical protein